jgi:ribosomal protein L35AE/L33A
VKGKHLSHQRGKRNTNPNTSLLKIEGVDDTNAAKYVLSIHTLISEEPVRQEGKRKMSFGIETV